MKLLTKNSVREKLLLERWVPGITNDQGSKNGSDSSSWSSNSDGSSPSSDELGSRVNVLLGGGGVDEGRGGGPGGVPPCGHSEAGRDWETSDGRHGLFWKYSRIRLGWLEGSSGYNWCDKLWSLTLPKSHKITYFKYNSLNMDLKTYVVVSMRNMSTS